ncbi:hypothetical protein ABKN59_005096 [Abortiporus biennis]
MDSRGRSRDVSPIALARRSQQEQTTNPHVALHVSPQSNHKHSHSTIPVASSSRLVPSPRFYPPLPSPPSSSPSDTDDSVRRTMSSSSLSISPEDYYDSPPSPPRTLQDQMQVAYALDNMHLAKVLLLKLKGIEVSDDNDPRIAQVKDEDFNSSFLPCGGLVLEEEDERRCREGMKREQERRRRIAREARLKVCQRIWESSAVRYQEEKAKVARRKEDGAREKRRLEAEARCRMKEAKSKELDREHDLLARHTQQLRIPICSNRRSRLSYRSLPAGPSRSPKPSPPQRGDFQYSVMPPVPTQRLSPPTPRSPLNSPHRTLQELNSQNVPFKRVVACMQGSLFPVSEEEVGGIRIRRRRTHDQAQLFEELMKQDNWEESGRRSEESLPLKPRRASDECIPCSLASLAPCAVQIGTPSSSTTLTTRSNSGSSWFSFGGRSSRSRLSSISTLLTSPPSSFKSSALIPQDSLTDITDITQHTRHSCQRAQRTSVSLFDHPLAPNLPSKKSLPSPAFRGRSLARTSTSSDNYAPSPTRSVCSSTLTITPSLNASSGIVHQVGRSISTFLEMAAQFQKAYVKATMFTAGSDLSDIYSRSRSRSYSRSRSPSRQRGRWVSTSPVENRGRRSTMTSHLRPVGYRVNSEDVFVFLLAEPLDEISLEQASPKRPLIPLRPTSMSSPGAPQTHPRVFPPPQAIPRSPFRLPHPPPTITSRFRPIANPLMLRLKAAHNACLSYSTDGQLHLNEPSSVKEKESREKVLGIAWEGIGRSSLGWEISVC